MSQRKAKEARRYVRKVEADIEAMFDKQFPKEPKPRLFRRITWWLFPWAKAVDCKRWAVSRERARQAFIRRGKQIMKTVAVEGMRKGLT